MVTWKTYLNASDTSIHLSQLADTSCGLWNPILGNIFRLPIHRQLRQNSAQSRRMRAVNWLEILGLLALETPIHVELASSQISTKSLSMGLSEVFREQLIDTLTVVV